MTILKRYKSIKGYLHRFTLVKFGDVHIRVHKILKADETPFLHNHPFKYVSFIFSGGYNEQVELNGEIVEKQHKAPKLIFRSESTYHRITSVLPNTKTLFCAHGNFGWKLKPLDNDMERPEDGIYIRLVNNNWVYAKCEKGMYLIGNKDPEIAIKETRPSIYQVDVKEPIKQNI